MSNVNKKCKVHYEGTFNNGEVFDSSYKRGEPIEFTCGIGQMIKGFDEAVKNMNVGDIVNVHLMPEDAYGEADPQYIFTLDIKQLSGAENLEVDQEVVLSGPDGRPVPVKVLEKTDKKITFDANHKMAGRELNFKIELISVE